MIYKIYDRFDDSRVIFERESASLREAVLAAIREKVNLSGADLSGVNLSGADLFGVNLYGADLSGADLSGANLYGANLYGANLFGANLSGVNFSGADLSGADLYGVNLSGIKIDLWDVLLRAPREIDGLLLALREGRVNGSCYEGECACLVGTIANVAHVAYTDLELVKPNSSRPAERWFLAIRQGDTPDTSSVVRLTVEWIEEFKKLLVRAVDLSPIHVRHLDDQPSQDQGLRDSGNHSGALGSLKVPGVEAGGSDGGNQ